MKVTWQGRWTELVDAIGAALSQLRPGRFLIIEDALRAARA